LGRIGFGVLLFPLGFRGLVLLMIVLGFTDGFFLLLETADLRVIVMVRDVELRDIFSV